MRDVIAICFAASFVAGVVCYVKWRTRSIYEDTQRQYDLNLGD